MFEDASRPNTYEGSSSGPHSPISPTSCIKTSASENMPDNEDNHSTNSSTSDVRGKNRPNEKRIFFRGILLTA